MTEILNRALFWIPSAIDHKAEYYPQNMGVSMERAEAITLTVDALVPQMQFKAMVIERLVNDGIVENAHELAIAAGYLEAVCIRNHAQNTPETSAKLALAIASGMLTSMFENGTIDEFVRRGKEAHAQGKLKVSLGDALVKGSKGTKH